jgi:hypothetical protein
MNMYILYYISCDYIFANVALLCIFLYEQTTTLEKSFSIVGLKGTKYCFFYLLTSFSIVLSKRYNVSIVLYRDGVNDKY